MERSIRWKRNSVLAMNTFGFTVMFAVWVIFAIVGLAIRKELSLGDTQFAVLVALPVLTGSVLRLPVGILTDRYGGRILFTLLLATTAIPLLLLTQATAYWQYLALGLWIGLAGTSFAIGIAYTSAWFPQERQGTALGIFGAGNTGASLTKLLAPALMTVIPAGGLGLVPGGWRFVPFVYAIVLLASAVLYWTFTFTDHTHHKHAGWKEMVQPLKHVRVWRFSLYYFLVFGGYVALSLWLPKYYMDVYGLPLKTAALLTALFVFPSGIIRAPGGWLSDHFGARTVMYWVLGTCVACSFMLSFPDVRLSIPLASRGGAPLQPLEIALHMGPGLFTFVVFVLGLAMGIGKAAVYKHIPHYFPDRVGAVGGLVGVIGGLGGFIMPILFGALVDRTRLPTTTFLFVFGLSAACLVWMVIVVHRLTRAAAPAIAEDLESGRDAVAMAEFAAGGGSFMLPTNVRRLPPPKRAAGSE